MWRLQFRVVVGMGNAIRFPIWSLILIRSMHMLLLLLGVVTTVSEAGG